MRFMCDLLPKTGENCDVVNCSATVFGLASECEVYGAHLKGGRVGRLGIYSEWDVRVTTVSGKRKCEFKVPSLSRTSERERERKR